jgi:hypothetical protein
MRSFRSLGLRVRGLVLARRRNNAILAEATFDRHSYPNVEAHLFTAADVSGWTPSFSDTYDVVCRREVRSHEETLMQEWRVFLSKMETLTENLTDYRHRIEQGEYPTVIWAHTNRGWHRREWNASSHPVPRPEDFIGYVDVSIRPHILRLNDLGFGTMESCSGLKAEHPDREPYWPYVMFDERTYPGIAPHLFTLADIAGWIPTLAPHSFDVYVKVRKDADVRGSWDRLVTSAVALSDLLKQYRQRMVLQEGARTDLDRGHTLQHLKRAG